MMIHPTLKFSSRPRMIIVSFLIIYAFAFLFYFLNREFQFHHPLLAFGCALISIAFVLISLYYTIFLIRFGKPYIRISQQRLEIRTLFKSLNILLQDIDQTQISVEDLNFFQSTVILHLTQKSTAQHHVIPLFFLSKHHHFEIVTLLSLIYYLPESERDTFIQFYQQDIHFDFKQYLNIEQTFELDLLGYLLISSQKNYNIENL